MNDSENSDSWSIRFSRPLLRLVSVGLGIGCGALLLGAVIVALVGTSADRSLLAAASPGEPAVEPLEIFAGIPPAAYLVARIGGPYVHVEVLVQPGQDPHIFEPTPRQVISLTNAQLFFRVGMPFEDRLIEHFAGGPARINVIDTSAGIRPGSSSDDDEAGQPDPHIWLSPPLLKIMAGNIATALCQADPPHEQVYQTNLKMLRAELDALNHRIEKSLSPYRGQAFYVFHPAFGYFAAAYGLRQESVEVGGKPPTPQQIFALINKARKDHVKIIFLQPQFNQQIAASIAQAIGGAVMPMDDLAYDVLANLGDVAEKIAASNHGKAE